MRVLIRTSLLALWSRRVGSLALPVTILPVFLHRERLITSSEFVAVELVALVFAVLAILLATGAFVRLWVTGDRGWGKAFAGIVFGLICLAPFGWFGYLGWRYPALGDASTTFIDPPALIGVAEPKPLDEESRMQFDALYPNAQSRTYPIEATEMYPVVAKMAEEWAWQVLTETVPTSASESGQLNAIAMTLIGFRDEVAVRVSGGAKGATVAMRSVGFAPAYDFGENGHRIEAFLSALDQQVTLMMRNAPVAAPDEAEDAETDDAPAAD